MIKFERNTVVVISVVIASILALLLVGATLEAAENNTRNDSTELTTFRYNMRSTLIMTLNMETHMRGYLLSGNDQFLTDYNAAAGQVAPLFTMLRTQAADLDAGREGPPQAVQLTENMFTAYSTWRTQWAEPQIEARKQGNSAAIFSAAQVTKGKQLFDDFRSATQTLESLAVAQIGSYQDKIQQISTLRQWLLLVIGVLALLSAVWAMFVLRRDARLQQSLISASKAEAHRLQDLIENIPVAVRLIGGENHDIILQNRLASKLTPIEDWNRLGPNDRLIYYQIKGSQGNQVDVSEMPSTRALRDGVTTSQYDVLMNVPGLGMRNLAISAAPLKDEKGKVEAAVIVLQDITAAKEMDQRKDEFIATAAHELRNPLTALSGHYQLLKRLWDIESASPTMQRQLEGIGKQITRLNVLIEHLLDASRIELGRLILDKSQVNLTKLAQTVLSEVRSSDNEAHELVLDPTEGDVIGSFDETRIGQVLTNLVSNAARYSPQGSTIKVVVGANNGTAKVQVIDNGPGVPPEQREALFTRYYQASEISQAQIGQGSDEGGRRHRRSSGLGLGLYISSEIVKAHGGEIGVTSNPDGGSIFWFTLPR